MIAPYWSDVDTRCGGDIYYRQVKLEPGSDLFEKIQRDVSLTGLGADFKPTVAIIVTWEAVMSQNGNPCQDQRVSLYLYSMWVTPYHRMH